MQPIKKLSGVLCTMAVALFAGGTGRAQQPPLPVSPTIRSSGQAVFGAYEGWYTNPDGSFTMLLGYFNRNEKQVLDVPVGADNRIEPGGPDMGQPTHFMPRRQFGVFTVHVPKDFGHKRLTWTLTANGQTTSIDMHLDPNWAIEPFEDRGSGNRAPEIRFEPGGPSQSGPPTRLSVSYDAVVGHPTTLVAFLSDVAANRNVLPGEFSLIRPPIAASWSRFRGPADVTFEPPRPLVDFDHDGRATTTATFHVPGDYVLRLQANDNTGDGGGGFQCCWTNALVKVHVTPDE
jgi:hypothetical protein